METDLILEVGNVSGRLTSLETRVDRNEKAVWDKLDGIDTKLDGIKTTLSINSGERSGSSRLLHWLVTALGMAMAWWGGHSGSAH